jgi:uncharacterized membrane protein YhaH (DUF805 family)
LRADIGPIDWALKPVKSYAQFRGRAPRAEYWWFYLGTVIVGIVLGLIDRMFGTKGALADLANLALLLPWISVTVRRLHDTDRSGGWLLAFVGAFVLIIVMAAISGMAALGGALGASAGPPTAAAFTGLIVAVLLVLGASVTFLVLMVLPGTEGPNRYGPDPYGPDSLEEVFA